MRRLALTLGLFLLSAQAEESVRVQAVLEEEAALKVKVEAPPGSIVLVKVSREFGFPGSPAPILVSRRIPVGRDGTGEALLRSPEFPVPGRYRVKAALESSLSPSAEVLLDGIPTRRYLEALRKARASLEGFLAQSGDFLDRLTEMRTLTASDLEKGTKSWEAWRIKARPELEEVIRKSREQGGRFYPGASVWLSGFLTLGPHANEDLMFEKIGRGDPELMGFYEKRPFGGRKDLEPYEEVFRKETLAYRLLVLKSLAGAVQRKQGARAEWDGVLDLWTADLGKDEAPWLELGAAFKAWLDSPEDPEKKRALDERFRALSEPSK